MRAVALALALVVAAPAAGQQVRIVPVELQVRLLLKGLSYERARAGEPKLSLVVLSRPGDVGSGALAAAFADAVGAQKAEPGRLEVQVLPWGPATQEAVLAARPRLLYVSANLADALPGIRALAKTTRSLTVGCFPEYEQELGLGILLNEDRPQLVANLPVLREAGVDFDAQFLKLTRPVR
jgi:hypothetical protein